ncbi:fatty acid desaturase family protein [Archangium primigenium]|uniref:fatty acid desaturase family protein n=1 Tax=[Archangium] primigenium TaxID=2792470 RepID=UPI00195DFB7A|nr:fatty acid desaturase [Archangium primigenium]MBM7116957.1 fatty acid desaturase [Archangium primigenium]
MSLSPARAPEEFPVQEEGRAPSEAPVRERRSPVQDEIHALRRVLQSRPEWSARLLELQRPRPVISLAYIATAWLGLGLSWGLVEGAGLALLPVALLLTASAQRLLNNSLHDAAHGNILRGGETLFQVLLAAPMFEDFQRYRALHLRHHARLHTPEEDPDHLSLPVRPGDGETGPSAARVYLRALGSARLWKSHCLGELPALGWRGRGRVLLWWAGVLGVLAGVAGPGAALRFAGLWLLARATTYHALKVFTELADHSGLEVGTVLSYTRNAPRNALGLLLHPFGDNYHLTHHLAPRVPMPNLHATHQLMWHVPEYRAGHHCDGYFLGHYPVTRSWLRAWNPPRARLHEVR